MKGVWRGRVWITAVHSAGHDVVGGTLRVCHIKGHQLVGLQEVRGGPQLRLSQAMRALSNMCSDFTNTCTI